MGSTFEVEASLSFWMENLEEQSFVKIEKFYLHDL